MAEEERIFNYNDLNLDFLELSPPRARPVLKSLTPVPSSTSFRPNAFKAKQLAQKVAQNDLLINKIEILKSDNFVMQQKLKDFQKSALQIQELYENEKKKCTDLQTKSKKAESNLIELKARCVQLDSDVQDKELQVEQLLAQIEQEKGPVSFTELAIKYMKLLQKCEEEETSNCQEKTLFADLSKYCEERGFKAAILKLKSKKKRIYKRDRDVQCNLLEDNLQKNSKDCNMQSTQTSIPKYTSIQSQTEWTVKHMQTQTIQSNEETKSPKKFITQAVQTTSPEFRSQGTQHISITTTRATSTSCFIKKHNVGTCFPEPTFISPVTVMVEELLQFYNVSPLSPITDPIPPATVNDVIDVPTPTSVVTSSTQMPITYNSVGTCTYICNVQRQIDFIPAIRAIKRSQSSSPSPCTCDNIKYEAYSTPTTSPPLPRPPKPSSSSNQDLPTQTSSATSSNAEETDASFSGNLSNMQPMLNAFTQLPEMQPEVFSTIWQMAGQMFMGLLYPPANNRSIRNTQFNRSSNSIDHQQFNNWLYTLYESMQQQQPQQPSTSSEVVMQTRNQGQEDINNREIYVDSNTDANNTNVIESNSNKAPLYDDENSSNRNTFGPNDGAQTITSSSLVSQNSTPSDCIFKEPLEIPKRSVKQERKLKSLVDNESTYMKKIHDKRQRKKQKKDKKHKNATSQVSTSSPTLDVGYNVFGGHSNKESSEELRASQQEELDFATAVEFCANLCSFNNTPDKESNQCKVFSSNRLNNTITAIEQDLPNISCNQLKHEDVEAKIEIGANNDGKEEIEMVSTVMNVTSHLEQNGIKNEKFNGKDDADVPDVTHSGFDKNKCDNFDSIKTLSATVKNPVHSEDLQSNNNATKSIFGSDSEDEDFATSIDENIVHNDSSDVQTSAPVLKNPSLPTCNDRKEKSLLTKEYSPECRNDNWGANETRKSALNLLVPQCPTLKSNNSVADNENAEEVVNPVDQVLCDLSMSDSEGEDNEFGAMKPFDNASYDSCAGSEYTDESVLVIAEEEDIAERSNEMATTSETTKVFVAKIQASTATPFTASTHSTPAISSKDSTKASNTLVDDSFASQSAQLCNNIMRESANEPKATTDVISTRKRGRKRKSELLNISSCKRSARLQQRAQQNQNQSAGEVSSDESCLSSPTRYWSRMTKKQSDFSTDDAQIKNAIQANKKSILHAFSNERKIGEQNSHMNDVLSCQSINEARTKAFIADESINLNSTTESGNNSTPSTCVAAIEQCENVKSFIESSLPTNGNGNAHSNATKTATTFSVATDCSNNLLYSSSEICEPVVPSVEDPLPSNLFRFNDYESPASPTPSTSLPPLLFSTDTSKELNDTNMQLVCREIPLELNRAYYSIERKSLMQHLISNYSADTYAIVTGNKNNLDKHSKIALQLEKFLTTTRDRVDILASTLAQSLHEEIVDTEMISNIIVNQIINAPRPEIELNCELARVPSKYIGTHLRLISIVLRHLQLKRPEIASALLAQIEQNLFNYQNIANIKLEAALNLTQLYLVVIPMHKTAKYNPARLFIAKCLYYYNAIAPPMIYEVLCWYPTTLPNREDNQYDRSDAIISVIQHLLMCTTYNMDSKDLRHRELLSLLRYEYHFEPFQPKALEVLSNLVAKLKSGHLTNLKYAFAIFCKRQTRLVDILLQQQLLPLADEYYKLAQNTNEYDERIAALLDCISAVVKPFPLDTNVTLYHSIFERFLVAVQRPIVQEAAVLAILRLQRFGHNRCFHALTHFKPNYSLQLLTSNALKTFIHKKSLKYWKSLLAQNKQ